MTALFYFPSRAERKAIAAGEVVLAPNGTLAVAGSQSPGVECCPAAAAGTPQPELPLSGAPDAPAPADAGTSPGYTNGPASAGPFHGCTGVPVRAMEAVLAERMRAILDFGHTPEKDLQLPLVWLPQEARNYLIDAIDEARRGPDRRAIARRKLIKAGALLLAAIDRLDAEPAHHSQEAA